MNISVPERGRVTIGAEQLRELRDRPAFIRLIENGIFEIRLGSKGDATIVASHFVGRAQVDKGVSIEVVEKVPGSVSGLFDILSSARLRFPKSASYVTERGHVFYQFADAFLGAVETYVSFGRLRKYADSIGTTSRPSGRILFSKSFNIAARGDYSRLVVSKELLTPDTSVNQILACCLLELEHIAVQYPHFNKLLYRSRALFLLFADVSTRHLTNLNADAREVFLERAIRSASDSRVIEFLQLVTPLFLGAGLFGAEDRNFTAPSVFIDLEYLFEHACRRALNGIEGIQCERERKIEKRLFYGSNRYVCNPDLVVSLQSGEILGVGDVKYKDLEGKGPANDDIYQLLAHASAFNASQAFLVYPGREFGRMRLGKSATGIEVDFFRVRPDSLRDDISMLCELYGWCGHGFQGVLCTAQQAG